MIIVIPIFDLASTKDINILIIRMTMRWYISDTKRNTSGIEYDFRNLPLTMQKGAKTLKYRYDETGNRILKRAGGKTEYYVRDHSGREVGIYDKDDGWTSFNLFGNGLIGRADVNHQTIRVEDPEEGMVEVQQRFDERFYYIKDHLGSIRVTIDQTNQVTAAQDYSAYGEIWRDINTSTPTDRYKFTEKELDIETGYAYHGARYYDPWRITWNSPDPLEDKFAGFWSYNYCVGNPNNYHDPDGRNPILIRILQAVQRFAGSPAGQSIQRNATRTLNVAKQYLKNDWANFVRKAKNFPSRIRNDATRLFNSVKNLFSRGTDFSAKSNVKGLSVGDLQRFNGGQAVKLGLKTGKQLNKPLSEGGIRVEGIKVPNNGKIVKLFDEGGGQIKVMVEKLVDGVVTETFTTIGEAAKLGIQNAAELINKGAVYNNHFIGKVIAK